MRERTSAWLFVWSLAVSAHAQEGSGGLSGFTTANERFMVFDHGRFLEVSARAPRQVWMNDDRLAFLDPSNDFFMVQDGRTALLDHAVVGPVLASRHELVWKVGNVLKRAREQGSEVLTSHCGDVVVTDSLVAFHDRGDSALNVCWRDRVITVATVQRDAEAPQWQLGRNTLVFFDKAARRVWLFHRGDTQVLFDSTDVGRVAPGGDVVAYQDDHDDVFKVFDYGRTVVLEELPPRSFKAADGVVAYVSNTGKFKVHRAGKTSVLMDHPPTEYWVQDSVVLAVDRGWLLAEEQGKAEVVERYVPEQWDVTGATITYLDLDRGIHTWIHAKRERLAQGMATERFERTGDVVTWKGTDGLVRCWWQGRTYTY